MADSNAVKIAKTGIDPITGSILSPEVRNALLKQTTIDSAAIRNDLLSIENQRQRIDAQNNSVIIEQEKALIGFNSNIQALRNDIGKLGTNLNTIALLLQQDSAEEQQRIRNEQENQRKLTEKQIRIGKESEIEQKIQSALLEPVQTLTPKVNDVFDRIKNALAILFGGWLTNQTVQAIKASEENNTKLFNDIKYNILKNLAIIGGGLFAIRTGFSLVTRTIGGIASGLTRLLIAKPLAGIANLFRGALPGKGGKGGGIPSSGSKGGGLGGALGNIITGASGIMNFLNGEYVDTALAALTFVPGGGIFKGLRMAAGTVFTIDQIAELFGKNFTGANPDLLAQKKKELEEHKKNTTTSSTKPVPTVIPQQDIMGKPTLSAPTPPAASTPTPSSTAPSQEMIQKYEQAWQYRNNPLARGRIESEWNKLNPEQQQQAQSWAKSKGYDWSEMKLTPSTPNTSDQIAPAQISMPPKQPQQVGQLPEPKPSLTMIKTSSQQPQNTNIPLTNGPLTDVPLINSSNPDNFYVLYSKLSYNVVT